MKILFYLPVITEPWFNHIVGPLIRLAATEAEVHVIAPPMWSLTGITERQLSACADLTGVRWHMLDGADHPSYRTEPADREGLADFVRAIDADYTFCRSADIITPGLFPGRIRYLMEGGFPPLPPAPLPRWGYVMLHGPDLFDHGTMPLLEPAQRDWLDARIAPVWDVLQTRYRDRRSRATYLAEAGLPTDRKIIAVPLEYDAPDNFFYRMHSIETENDRFVADLAAGLDKDCLLAVTIHPIQDKLRLPMIDRIAAMDPDKVRIVRSPSAGFGGATQLLAQHCDAMILRDSKSFSHAAFFGKPMLRLSRFAAGEWLNAYTELPEFMAALRSGTARTASAQDVRIWFAYHYANNAFPAGDEDMTLADLLDRADRPFNPDRWAARLDQHRSYFHGWLADTAPSSHPEPSRMTSHV